MKLVNFYRKPISMFVMVTFTILLCFWANQAPAAPSASAAEKNSGTTMEQGDSGSPNFIETESESAAAAKKHHKFPWLLVGAVVVVGAAALYFLVIKKIKYELTVTLSAGTTGTPAATAKYNKGQVVNYSYSAQAGYSSLQVRLDGIAVEASGTVTMDKAHTITTSAAQEATLQVNSTPAGAKIYLNKVDSGQVTPYTFSYAAAASMDILLRRCGYQDYSKTQSVVLGQTYSIDATLLPGILDNFLVSSTCWKPHTASEWTVSDGVCKFTSDKEVFNYSLYNYSFNQTNWTVEVKMKRVSGNVTDDNAIMLIERMDGTKAYGYYFSYQANGGAWFIIRFNGYDIYNGGGSYTFFAAGSGRSIHSGLDQWNTLKVVRAGTLYSYYINNTKVRGFMDSRYSPRYLVLGIMLNKQMCEMQYDYVKLNFSANTVDVCTEPFADTIPTINWPEHN